MGRSAVNIVLEEFHIRKNGMVDPLEDIILLPVRPDEKGIVDKAIPQWMDFKNVTFDGEMGRNLTEGGFCAHYFWYLAIFFMIQKTSGSGRCFRNGLAR